MAAYGITELTATVRRLGVLSGYSKSTAALALSRVSLDGWIETAKEADADSATGRRIRLAHGHQCPADRHHMCAHYGTATLLSDDETADHHGSDRSGTPRPPGGGVELYGRLETVVVHQQAGIWHRLGHHAARTLEVIEDQPGLAAQEITERTGYSLRTTRRHLGKLADVHLIELTDEGTAVRTSRTLYEAGQAKCVASRPVELATLARVEQSVYQWWCREAAWWQLDRSERRQQGPRASATQQVLDGMDPYARAYPRRPAEPGELGDADHDRAFAIEAARIGAGQLAAEASELARTGQVIDPARLGHQHLTHHTGRHAA